MNEDELIIIFAKRVATTWEGPQLFENWQQVGFPGQPYVQDGPIRQSDTSEFGCCRTCPSSQNGLLLWLLHPHVEFHPMKSHQNANKRILEE